jgi:Mrp family chromosome partitioning ATPase
MPDHIDMTTALQVVRRRAWIVLVAVAAALLAAQLVTDRLPRRYDATATLYLDGSAAASAGPTQDPGLGVALSTLAQTSATAFARLAGTRTIARDAAATARAPLGAAVGHLRGDAQPGVQLVSVTADASSPDRAVRLANGAAAALARRVPQLSASRSGGLSAQLADAATPPSGPASPRRGLNLLFGGLAGLLAGLVLAGLVERLDRRIRSAADVEEGLGLPVLGELPPMPRRAARMAARERHAIPRLADPYRSLAATVAAVTAGERHRRLLISSACPGEGKSTVAAHLALGLWEHGETTALVECDLHHPTQARHFPVAGRPPLIRLLAATNGHLPESCALEPGLKVLAMAPDESRGTVSVRSTAFEHALDTASAEHERVVLDAPPVLGLSDTAIVARRADAAVLVFRCGAVRERDARAAAAALGRLGVPVLGVVLRGVRAPRRLGYYGR